MRVNGEEGHWLTRSPERMIKPLWRENCANSHSPDPGLVRTTSALVRFRRPIVRGSVVNVPGPVPQNWVMKSASDIGRRIVSIERILRCVD